MALKPWYKVIDPREDLCQGRPLDAAEFAVHLDQVRDGRARDDYQKPERFFDRTYLTQSLLGLAGEVVRRLSGEVTETSAIFNMATQFGGGKTHALTLLYHLAEAGPQAEAWKGVRKILVKAGVESVPQAATAVFVGTEFDSITGRGGDDGTPNRKTPWGEIAFQLGDEEALALVAEHEKQAIAPAGDVIRRMLPNDKPCLILLDEVMNYVSRNRKSGLGAQFYDFVHSLSETVRGEKNVVLAVSIPASELEMTAEDQADYERFKKMLDRLGKAVIMSAESETSEIIRRRLFEWEGLPREAKQTAAEYADWVQDHRQQIPDWFPVDQAREAFSATYPFHPMALSVFERKWQALPRFQRTRGILRLLALWVAKAYEEGIKGRHRDPLIGIGTAPLDDPIFRAAAFEQLGTQSLEAAVTTDIAGKRDAHAMRLDAEAVDTIKKARLHRKVSTAIFFESNGGQTRAEATLPEVRLACAEPALDIGNVETCLEELQTSCYYLLVEGNRYRFSLKPNLNKLLADRRASRQLPKIDERIRGEVQKVFTASKEIEPKLFPEETNQIPDRAALRLVVLAPEHGIQDKQTMALVEKMTRECGQSSRTLKNSLIFAVAENDSQLREEARSLLAWEDIRDEEEELRLDDPQKRELAENLKKAQRDLKESVWRTYKNLVILAKGNTMRVVDLGLVHSSARETLPALLLGQLRDEGELVEYLGPRILVKNWPAFSEWSTKAVRDAVYASPLFPKLLNPESIKDTIASGVSGSMFAYVGKVSGGYDPFRYGDLSPDEVEIADDMFIIPKAEAEKQIQPPTLTALAVTPDNVQVKPGKKQTFTVKGLDQHGDDIATGDVAWSATGGAIDEDGVFTAGDDEGSFVITAQAGSVSGSATVAIAEGEAPPKPVPPKPTPGIKKLTWSGEVPCLKWMNFYTKVLSGFATSADLKIRVSFEAESDTPLSDQKVEDTKTALRELGLGDDVRTE